MLPYPQKQNVTPLIWWLILVSGCLLLMICVGGATRVTESGLSLTRWEVFRGFLPPFSQQSWEAYFAAYQKIPQYKYLNAGMTLAEFKYIFWWEWGHRFLGRMIGLVYALPLVWFWRTRQIPPGYGKHFVILLGLGGLQGFVGWWMVRSGLVHRVDVAHLRLAIHLILATAILTYMITLALSLYYWNDPGTSTGSVSGVARRLSAAEAPKAPVALAKGAGTSTCTAIVLLLICLCLLQIFFGGLVAGLNAGKIYTTWPLMDGRWIPDGLFIQSPWWKNIFDNVLMVQFQHRSLGLLLVFGILFYALVFTIKTSSAAPYSLYAICLSAIAQVCLGVLTLLAGAPRDLALLHQLMAFGVLISLLVHFFYLRTPDTEPVEVPGSAEPYFI